MNKPEQPIHQRLNFLIEQLEGGVQRRFAQRLGVTSGAIGDILGQRKSKPGFDFVGKILRAYPQLRPEWLLLGEGEMLKSAESLKNNSVLSGDGTVELHIEPDTSGNRRAPLINLKAAANYAGYQSQEMLEQVEMIALPAELMPGRLPYFAFRVTGESMEPTFHTDDIVLCQQLPRKQWLDLRKEVLAVVVSISNGIQFKRVTARPELRQLRCRSDNPRYLPFNLSLDDSDDKQSDVTELWAFEWLLTKRGDPPSVALADRVAHNENEIGDLRYLLETILDEREVNRRLRERDRRKDNT